MTSFFLICMVWISICVDLLSAEPEISVSGPVGSTAVLPCELTSVDTDKLYIRWRIESEIVFERVGEEKYQAEGYEGRVDVPKDALRKGDCSLVLHNLTHNDTGIYMSHQIVTHTKRSASLRTISRVNLSVSVLVPKETPKPTPLKDTAQVNCLHPPVLIVSLLSFTL